MGHRFDLNFVLVNVKKETGPVMIHNEFFRRFQWSLVLKLEIISHPWHFREHPNNVLIEDTSTTVMKVFHGFPPIYVDGVMPKYNLTEAILEE